MIGAPWMLVFVTVMFFVLYLIGGFIAWRSEQADKEKPE